MEKFIFSLLFPVLLILPKFLLANGEKSFLIHSYSDVFGSSAYTQKLLESFSTTSDGKMLEIRGNFEENDTKLTFNLNTKSSNLVKQNYTQSMVTYKYCNVEMNITMHVFAIVTDQAQAAILVYGCSTQTLETTMILFLESFTPEISKDILEILSRSNIKLLKSPFKVTQEGFCTCSNLQQEIINYNVQLRSLLVIGLGIFGTLTFIAIAVKLYKVIEAEEIFPYLP